MSVIPAELGAYTGLLTMFLLFLAGLLFGVGAKKAVTSAFLIVAGILLAGVLGLSIPLLSASYIFSHIIAIFSSQAQHLGPIFYSFPIFWIVGAAIGIWKG
ncbi:MAG: hypothetical protein ACRECH_11695 [Nitrososphaerales archaeon]